MSLTERFSDIIGNKIEDKTFHILGCGAIGSSAATQLARCGALNMKLYDMDTVSSENIGVSQYSFKDIDKNKVDALKELIKYINPICVAEANHGQFKEFYPDPFNQNIVILGFDSMASRLEAVTMVTNCSLKPIAIIDGRMGAEHYQQYTIIKPTLKKYLKTWYSDEDGDPEPCNAKATSYCSSMSGSFIANTVRKLITGQPFNTEINFNFPTLLLGKSKLS
tara:strand:- start:26981 stop:27646 length:666 start_codon:yes stop_codon:yes gene_type:complete